MKFDTLEQAIDWLGTQSNSKTRVNNQKIAEALKFLGNPEKNLPIIHVTGTNGKGSVVAYLKNLLLSQGLNVGTFTSPHIMRLNERITYNGEEISDEDLLEIIQEMVAVNDYLSQTEYGRLVYFENYTVMMALYFQRKPVDVIVCEVGIGGYNDATNVMDGQVAIITTIGLDHGDKIGNTLEEVAYEKSGIIKKEAKVVTGRIPADPLLTIDKKAKEEHASHYSLNTHFGCKNIVNMKNQGSNFTYWCKNENSLNETDWHISMIGDYQVDNASVAITAFQLWMELNQLPIDLKAAQATLSQTQWIARMERISHQPLIYIDGAHNSHGLRALKKMIQDYFPDKEITLIYAGLKTKNQQEQLGILKDFTAEKLYLTTFGHFEAMEEADFMKICQENQYDSIFIFEHNWQELINRYQSEYQDNQLLLITGSLYFVSEVRKYIVNK